MSDEGWRLRVLKRDKADLLPRFEFESVVKDWVETMETVFAGRPAAGPDPGNNDTKVLAGPQIASHQL
jgi:hypothetical protein